MTNRYNYAFSKKVKGAFKGSMEFPPGYFYAFDSNKRFRRRVLLRILLEWLINEENIYA